ncbi:MAG TPA: ankyrin repeat domain-containing protein [Verrucomicrobiae bacterium]|nr:ankyrin repeat domain-containing protein [Verrucomicrobiae bacterium]
MEIKIECPSCGQRIAIDDSWRGRSMPCPSCNSTFCVPKNPAPKARWSIGKILLASGIIGLLLLTNALVYFYWQHDAQKLELITRNESWHAAVHRSLQPSDGNALWHLMNDDANLPQIEQILDAHPEFINQRYGKQQSTLLSSAAWSGSVNIVAELLKLKADVNAKNLEGRTALFSCIQNQGTKEIVEMLLDHGADFTIPDNHGVTPLKLAMKKNKQDIVELLRQHGARA